MLSWIIQITIISIILIFLVHHLINFFKSTLTVPKIKDLVNNPTQKYESMYNIIKGEPTSKKSSSDNNYTLIDLLPKEEEQEQEQKEESPSMKNELKNFLKKQLLHSSKSLDSISETGIGNSASYSNY